MAHPWLLAIGLAGLAASLLLVIDQGMSQVWQAMARLGWGFALIVAWRALSLVTAAQAWRSLLLADARPSLGRMSLWRWICEAINSLLPVAQIGGDLVRARLAGASQGAAASGAAVVVDITLNLLMQCLFALLALAFLIGGSSAGYGGSLAATLFLSTGGIALFWALQKRGLFGLLARFVAVIGKGASLDRALVGAENLDQSIRALYARPGDLATALFWHTLSTASRVGEVWLILFLMGSPATLAAALIIESLTALLRTAAFLVPGGLGVQEGSLLALGSLVGIAPEAALAMALIKRGREISVGLMGLLAWGAVKSIYASIKK
ncbi:MAG: flippase-like domain-containing protein [Alphaproteobacteria bacterium]|nr:flippase-like domain-containing protein [Alphaproteobacteria bacterium]